MNIRAKIREPTQPFFYPKSSLKKGTFLYDIINTRECRISDKKVFYVQNHESYLDDLEKNYNYYNVPFKKPNVCEIEKPKPLSKKIVSKIEYLDSVIVDLNVLKNGKVRVKINTDMFSLYENWYNQMKLPPIKIIIKVYKNLGYDDTFLNKMLEKNKKRGKMLDKGWKQIEDFSEATKKSKKRKGERKKERKEKREEVKPEVEPEVEPEIEIGSENELEENNEDGDKLPKSKDDDENDEDGAMDIENDEDENDDDEYISECGEDD